MEISDDQLQEIQMAPKHFRQDQQRQLPKTQCGSMQWNFNVELDDETSLNMDVSDLVIKVFARQRNSDEESFSCGIRIERDGEKAALNRYNGPDHDNGVAHYQCHIHRATAEGIRRGDRKQERKNIQVTDRYEDLRGALRCLCTDYKIRSLPDGLTGLQRRLSL